MVMRFSEADDLYRKHCGSCRTISGDLYRFIFLSSEQPTLVEEDVLRMWAAERWPHGDWVYRSWVGIFLTDDPDIALEFKLRWF